MDGHVPSGAERGPRLANTCFTAMACCGSLESACAVLKCSEHRRARGNVEVKNWTLEGAGRVSSKPCSREACRENEEGNDECK